MNTLTEPQYSKLKNFIEDRYNDKGDWDTVKQLTPIYKNMNFNQIIDNFVAPTCGIPDNILNKEIWEQTVDLLKKRDEKIVVTKLGKTINSDARIPVDSGSAWSLYKSKLVKQNWSEESIKSVEKSSFSILKNLSMDTIEEGPTKGLVIGNVQSGKTANMAGLVAMAADNGFNYFIILSGVIDNLREQTENRIYNDMTSSGYGNLHWHLVSNPKRSSKSPEHNISQFNLGIGSKDRYLTVCLKNKTRLASLESWLTSDLNKSKQLKILIIDDEADQASINTNKIDQENATAINTLIKKLVNSTAFKSMNYISYTATPYANVLNEVTPDSLYPKDFIFLLEPSKDYIGPKEIFGTEIPESSPFIEIVRPISDNEAEILREVQNGDDTLDLPKSLISSLHWFLLSVAAMRAYEYQKPISMLIHTSFKVSHHANIAKEVTAYLKKFKHNYKNIVPSLKKMYEDESIEFTRNNFLKGLKNYSSPDKVPDYPEWSKVKRYLDHLVGLPENEFLCPILLDEDGQYKYHKGLHLVIDNSSDIKNNVRLVYPTKQINSIAPAFIVIGGNTLARGLTLEGLTTTYFLRATNQADTLMQMGRWFGFRKGYEIFPRVWLDTQALERYQFLSQMNEELREEMANYAELGRTPSEYAPRVKNSPNYQLIKVTSKNKMQSAQAAEYDFLGFNTQTIYFEDNYEKLKNNIKYTEEFLNTLKNPIVTDNKIIFEKVEFEKIHSFINNYIVCMDDTKMSSLPALMVWAETNMTKLDDWNVIVSGTLDKSQEKSWTVQNYSIGKSKRTKLKHRSTKDIINIGSLRSPADLFADIKDIDKEETKVSKASEVQKIRKKYGYEHTPQLIIYRIDKGQELEVNNDRANRVAINAQEDLIGLNIMIPGSSKNNTTTTYISAKIDVEYNMIDEQKTQEEDSLIQ